MGGVEQAILSLARNIYNKYDLYFCYNSMRSFEIAKELAKYGVPLNLNGYEDEEPIKCDVLVYCSLWREQDNLLHKIKPQKRVLWCHAMIPVGNNKFYNKTFMRYIDDVVMVSKAALETIPKYSYGSNIRCRYHVIYNMLNTQRIKRKSYEDIEPLNLSNELNICTVARISSEKGWHRMKIICDELRKRQVDFKWFVVGAGYFSAETERIKGIFASYPEVEFLGVRDNPFQIVKQMDYSALLSNFESWGLVITEAKILDIPVICTDFPAAFEQIADGKTGIIFPLKDYNQYGGIVDRMLTEGKKIKNNLRDFDYDKENAHILSQWYEILD